MVTFYKYWNINPKREWVREFLAEFLGTLLLVFLGTSSVAESVLTDGKAGNPVTIYLGWGLGLYMGVMVSAGVSGAHLNPAITVAGAIVKKVDWVKVPHYLLGQYLGGFVAACFTYFLYMDTFTAYHNIHGANLTTAGVFATYPTQQLSIAGGFIDQILGSAVLIIGIYAILDKKNANVPLQLAPLYVSFVLIAVACSIGVNEGFAVNPARDFSPRLFTFATFWGYQVFQNSTYWYIPIVGPHIGAVLGAFTYVGCIEKMRFNSEETVRDEFNIEIVEKKVYAQQLPTSNTAKGNLGKPAVSQNGVYTCRL